MATAVAPELEAAAPVRLRSRRRQVIQAVFSIALVAAIFVFVLPKIADLPTVWAYVREMTWGEVAVLVVAAVWNLATYSFVWVACLPGLGYAQATVASEASTAVANTVPGGSYLAVGVQYSMLHSWGFRRSVVTLALLVTGIWNNFAKLALPVLALSVLAVQGQATPGRVTVGLLGIAALLGAVTLFTLALRSERSAARIGIAAEKLASPVLRLFTRSPATGWDIATTRFREKTIDLVGRRWHWITAATLVSHLSLFLVLLVTMRAVGVSESEVGWAEALAAFAFTRIVTAIPLTPGGLGVVELALTAGLVAAGGDREEVVASVLVYRFLTFLPPIPIGVASYVFWRRNRSWRRDPVPT